MKALLAALLVAVAAAAQAQPRIYNQAELDALLAPIALYPDPLLSQVLVAATTPDDVHEAAAWSRANAHLKGDAAVRAADPMPWDPSVKALLAYPDLLARMDESPQWTADLGAAFATQEAHVMATVQTLRQRAQASGYLQSDSYQAVQQHDGYIAVQPVYSHIVYVPWYNPFVVYGPWWWHSHRPIAWRHWHARPVVHHLHRPIQVHRPVQVHRPAHVERRAYIRAPVQRAIAPRPVIQGARQPAARPVIQGAIVRNPVHQALSARPAIQGARVFESRQQQRGQGNRGHQNRGRGRN